jgi:uncharacterized protein
VSKKNVEVVRAFHGTLDAEDREAWRECFHPDVVWDVTASGMPNPDVYHGHAGIADFFRDWFATWDELKTEMLEVVDAGDTVVVTFRQWGRGRISGAETDSDFFGVYDFSDGKVKRFRLFDSREAALAAAGLPRD